MLLSSMMRAAAITGSPDAIDAARVNAFFGGRQGGRWAQQTVAAAFPKRAPYAAEAQPAAREPSPVDPADALRELTKLRQSGVVTDAEFEALRAQLRA